MRQPSARAYPNKCAGARIFRNRRNRQGSEKEIMPFLEWKDLYSVGDTMVDAQHKQLIGYMNEFHAANAAGQQAGAQRALKSLVTFTVKHFGEEEALMQKQGYPDFAGHKKQHENLLQLVKKLVGQYQEDPSDKSAVALANFLKNWLVNHILGVDKKYTPYLAH